MWWRPLLYLSLISGPSTILSSSAIFLSLLAAIVRLLPTGKWGRFEGDHVPNMVDSIAKPVPVTTVGSSILWVAMDIKNEYEKLQLSPLSAYGTCSLLSRQAKTRNGPQQDRCTKTQPRDQWLCWRNMQTFLHHIWNRVPNLSISIPPRDHRWPPDANSEIRPTFVCPSHTKPAPI